MTHRYALTLPEGESLNLARRWLLLGVSALAVAGLFSVLIVLARIPALARLDALAGFFHVALVVHVDLSVLVWFLANAALLWSLLGGGRMIPYLGCAAFGCAAASTAFLSLSAFLPPARPVMSNYIPVLIQPLFFIGLGLLFSAMTLALLRLLTATAVRHESKTAAAQHFGIYSSGLMMLMALAAFCWSSFAMPPGPEGQDYYEALFWGGGHVLQFVYVQAAMVAWLWLAGAAGYALPLSPRLMMILYGVNLALVCLTPLGYFAGDPESSEHRQFFTHLMMFGNGATPLIVTLAILAAMLRRFRPQPEHRVPWASLLMSLVLFLFGGALGAMIEGQNVTIPAHYHGSIVGVTMAFMGLAYLLLPRLGYASVEGQRLAFWQPFVYGVGQLIHISALAYSGGYGVLRKTPASVEGGVNSAKVAMGIMGMGGLLAIIGGLMFVIVVIRSLRAKS